MLLLGASGRKKRLLHGILCFTKDQMSENHAVHDACFSSELILLLARLLIFCKHTHKQRQRTYTLRWSIKRWETSARHGEALFKITTFASHYHLRNWGISRIYSKSSARVWEPNDALTSVCCTSVGGRRHSSSAQPPFSLCAAAENMRHITSEMLLRPLRPPSQKTDAPFCSFLSVPFCAFLEHKPTLL